MKKIISLLIVLALSIPVHAFDSEKLSVKGWGGYATFDMSDVNKSMADMATDFAANATGAGATITKSEVTKSESGVAMGIDLNYEINENIMVGPRVMYMKPKSAEFVGEAMVPFPVTTVKLVTKVESSLIVPLMIGGNYKKDIADKISVSGGLCLGYGMFSGKESTKIEGLVPLGSSDIDSFVKYTGSAFVTDISANADYSLSDNFSIGVILGYALAKVAKVKATADNASLGVKKGDILKNDTTKENISVDFTGLKAGVSLNYKF